MANDSLTNLVKIRVKLGVHEFEAEGPPEIVAAHFRTWQQLIATEPPSGPPTARHAAALPPDSTPPATRDLLVADMQRQLVTLRQSPDTAVSPADAALLLLFGFQQLLGTPGRATRVTRLKAALTASGYPQARVDRTLTRHVAAGLVGKRGRRIGSTYQLTSSGLQHAGALAHRLSRRPPPDQ